MEKFSTDIIQLVSILAAILAVVVGLYQLIKTTAKFKLKFGNISIESDKTQKQNYDEIISSFRLAKGNELPFEIEQLAKYYTQILYQNKVSFWFSIVFAAIGFLIIILLIFTNAEIISDKGIVTMVSSIIIEAVSALFYTRSNKAQKEMQEFFNKLRKDRQYGEARKLIESLTNPMIKDIAKVQLALKYSEIENNTETLNEIIKNASVETLQKENK
jgi:uncharacterized membrane protein